MLAQDTDADPITACQLAVLLEDCRLSRDVDAMIETEVSMAQREGRSPAAEIVRLDDVAAGSRAACGAAPPELQAHEWEFLHRAALAGHEASMYRFVTDLPLAGLPRSEHERALAAWRRDAPAVLAALVQRRSPRR